MQSLARDGALDGALPSPDAVFRAFDLVGDPEAVRVIILGQDPYPNSEDAMGLAFSSPAKKRPASLRNIFKELESDLGVSAPDTGDLTHWGRQGILLANTALTIGAGKAPHFAYWQDFTAEWIHLLASTRPRVWVLWGGWAQKYEGAIMAAGQHLPHEIIRSAHPSPLSAYRGFFGSKPFSGINAALDRLGMPAIKFAKDAS